MNLDVFVLSQPQDPCEVRELQPGQSLSRDDACWLWRVVRGAMRVDCGAAVDSAALRSRGPTASTLVRMALPGDILGVEVLAGVSEPVVAQAVTPCVLTTVRLNDQRDAQRLLMQAVLQGHRRGRDMAELRTGPAAARLKRLLLLLADGDQRLASEVAADWVLPSLKDMACLIDAAPETVSRVLGRWRRMNLLQDRRPSVARFSRSALIEHRLVPGMTTTVRPGAAVTA